MLLTLRQPRLQYGQGIHGFFCQHRGNQFVSTTLMMPMTERFAADIRHYIDTRRLNLVRFAKGQSKDQVAKGYLAGEVRRRPDPVCRRGQGEDPDMADRAAPGPGDRETVPVALPGPGDGQPLVLLRVRRRLRPVLYQVLRLFPVHRADLLQRARVRQAAVPEDSIAFTSLDNAFGAVSDAGAVQRICDGLTDQKIYRFAGEWLARLPQPFTRADEDADYRWQLSVHQVEFSTTMALDRPLAGRIFFEQLIRDNLDIGRPDKVNLVFGRTIRQRGKFRTPGTFRTQVITNGACPYLYLFYRKTQVKQYLKEGRALRTETTFNQPRDLGIGKELTNLAALAKAGYAANRRLLDAECISHDPAAGTAALEMLTSPVISTTCTRVPGMRFPDPRVQALLAACCALALRPAASPAATCGTSLPPSWEKIPGTCPAARSATTCAGSAPTRSSSASRTAATTRSPPTACPPPCSSPG